MPVFVVGLNHRSAPLDLLERLAIDPERRPKALAMLLEREHVKEGAILSTCNRVQIYAEIGRASCRERGEISVVAGSLKKKRSEDVIGYAGVEPDGDCGDCKGGDAHFR